MEYDGNVALLLGNGHTSAAVQCMLNFLESKVEVGGSVGRDDEEWLQKALQISRGRLNANLMPRLSLSKIAVNFSLGFGSFGRIWQGQEIEGDSNGGMALKQLPARGKNLINAWKERDVMILLKHKRIVNIIGAFFERDIFFVFELCMGSVKNLVNRISPYNAVRFSIQLLEAVAWCHSRSILHLDIKPENVLVKQNNNIVLADFGSCVVLKEHQNESYAQMSASHGSPGYLDLDANEHLRFSKATDVFSVACVIFEMDTRNYFMIYPYRTEHTRALYADAIKNGRVIDLPAGKEPDQEMLRESLESRCMGSNFGFLLTQMICQENRLSADEALVHPALRSIMKELSLTSASLDNCDWDVVTNEVNVIRGFSFEMMAEDEPTLAMQLAMAPIYYDENLEVVQQACLSTASDASDSSSDMSTDHDSVSSN